MEMGYCLLLKHILNMVRGGCDFMVAVTLCYINPIENSLSTLFDFH
jgi:hypothetical protein